MGKKFGTEQSGKILKSEFLILNLSALNVFIKLQELNLLCTILVDFPAQVGS